MHQCKFMLLLGPSGVGKSTIIAELRSIDPRFVYISPYMTRLLRDGEKDKVSISDAEMDAKAAAGELVVINTLFNGIRYGTPLRPIVEALEHGNFPVLDWPVAKLNIMTEAFPKRLFCVYVAPPSLEALAERIARDGRDTDGSRLQSAKAELEEFWSKQYSGLYQLVVVTENNRIPEVAQTIYSAYLMSL